MVEKTEALEADASGLSFGGLILSVLGFTGLAEKLNMLSARQYGLHAIFDGIAKYNEARALKYAANSASNSNEVRSAIKTAEVMTYVQNIPAIWRFASLLGQGPMIFVVAIGDLVTNLLRIPQVGGVRKQIESHLEFRESGDKAKVSALNWIEKESNRQLPANITGIERVWEYIKAGIFGVSTITAILYGNVFFAITGALSVVYSLWKGGSLIPLRKRYYDALADEMKYIAEGVHPVITKDSVDKVKEMAKKEKAEKSKDETVKGKVKTQTEPTQQHPRKPTILVSGIPTSDANTSTRITPINASKTERKPNQTTTTVKEKPSSNIIPIKPELQRSTPNKRPNFAQETLQKRRNIIDISRLLPDQESIDIWNTRLDGISEQTYLYSANMDAVDNLHKSSQTDPQKETLIRKLSEDAMAEIRKGNALISAGINDLNRRVAKGELTVSQAEVMINKMKTVIGTNPKAKRFHEMIDLLLEPNE